MRLTARQIEQIKTIGQEVFGHSIRIYLFGSRVDDAKRGGDIDLFIEPEGDEPSAIEDRIKFLVRLKQAMGDQKIDVISTNSLKNRPALAESIKRNRVRLC